MYKIPKMSIDKICDILEAKRLGLNKEITYISTNSKESNGEEFIFFAFKGEKYDGFDFRNEAIKNGACAMVSERNSCEISTILVEDVKKAYGLLAKEISKGQKKICVTGSAGKTTVSNMIKAVLSKKYSVGGTYKNENNEIGVPITLLKGQKCEFNVIEMGMRGLGQIDWLSSLCEPEISVITNVGSAHIEKLGSKENVFKAKTEILTYTKSVAVLPCDERFEKFKNSKFKTVFVGNGGDLECLSYRFTNEGAEFDIKCFEDIFCGFKIQGFSLHNITNSMFAIAVGIICGVNILDIKEALQLYKGEEMREEIIQINGLTVINDCYNASYESMKNAIFNLKKYCEIKDKAANAIVGDMLELGQSSREMHYRIGEMAKDCGIKKLIAIGEYADNVLDGYMGGIKCNSVSEAVEFVRENLCENDVLLIKASRGMRLEKILCEMRKENE